MPYQGGQRSGKKAAAPNWTPTFPGAQFLFGPGFFAGRGASAATVPAAVPPAAKPPMPGLPADYKETELATLIPAGTVQPAAIVKGLTPAGEVDRSQSDEYKSQMARYRNLISQKKTQEAEDVGMKIWQEKYGKTPMAQPGGAVGAYNPLLASTFPETKGYAGTFAPVEEIQMGDLGTRAQGESGWTMESLNPLATQAAQQEATAAQADMATTVKLPIRNRVQAYVQGLQ